MSLNTYVSVKTFLLIIGMGLISEGARSIESNSDIVVGTVSVLLGIALLFAREHLKSLNGFEKNKKNNKRSIPIL